MVLYIYIWYYYGTVYIYMVYTVPPKISGLVGENVSGPKMCGFFFWQH